MFALRPIIPSVETSISASFPSLGISRCWWVGGGVCVHHLDVNNTLHPLGPENSKKDDPLSSSFTGWHWHNYFDTFLYFQLHDLFDLGFAPYS
jgi:hypothetical protein